MKNLFYYRTSIALIGIAEDGNAITNLWFQGGRIPGDAVERETALLAETNKQLLEYLSGERKGFTVPLAPEGTPFQKKVWESC